jgi:glycosyltransferase involved in cell wall biosynthesis
MRILQVTPTFVPSKFGGVKVVSYNISKALSKKGHEVTVYTTDADIGHLRLRNIENIKNTNGFNIRYFKNINNWLAFKYRLFLPLGMGSAIRGDITNFDIIHLHDYRSFLCVITHHYAKKYDIPYVLQAHGSVLPTFQKQRLKRIFDMFFGYRILRDASKVIALTETEAEQYKKMGVDKNKIEIVPNGIDMYEYENLPDRGGFRKRYSIRDDEKIILYIGRLHICKGTDLLIKAFLDLLKELDSIKLVFVGPDDGYRSTLEELIQTLKVNTKVLFTGFVSNDEKMAAFVDADVFVTPSFSGFPVTFLEACACGTPIITTNNGDKLDWIQDKVGYVVKYDKDQLRDTIFKVLSDEGLRKRFGEEGRRLVRENFSWDRVIRKVEGVYEKARNMNRGEV